jgi:hypothetical protein
MLIGVRLTPFNLAQVVFVGSRPRQAPGRSSLTQVGSSLIARGPENNCNEFQQEFVRAQRHSIPQMLLWRERPELELT